MADGKDYEVGYGKPPPEHRFKKGQSGNPRGRRRVKLNEAELLAKVRDELIPITINGKPRLVTFAEAAFRKTHMTVLSKGSVGDLEKLLKLYARFGAEPEALRNEQMREAANNVMNTIVEIFRKTRGDLLPGSAMSDPGEPAAGSASEPTEPG